MNIINCVTTWSWTIDQFMILSPGITVHRLLCRRVEMVRWEEGLKDILYSSGFNSLWFCGSYITVNAYNVLAPPAKLFLWSRQTGVIYLCFHFQDVCASYDIAVCLFIGVCVCVCVCARARVMADDKCCTHWLMTCYDHHLSVTNGLRVSQCNYFLLFAIPENYITTDVRQQTFQNCCQLARFWPRYSAGQNQSNERVFI